MVDEAALNRRIEDMQRQLRELPPSIADSLLPVVADLQETIEATIADTYYTKVQTDSRIGSPGAISPTSVASSGAVSATGVSSTGDVSAAAALRAPDAFITNAPGNVFTGTRVAGWWLTATGQAGTATSSERFKSNIVDAGIDPHAVLSAMVKQFNYTDEVRKRDDPTFEGYVGPDYHVADNVGFVAEQLHALGLWQFVVYERDVITETDDDGVEQVTGETLRLDADGNPIPFAVHDSLWGYAQQAVLQWFAGRIDDVERRLSAAGIP